MLPEISEDAAQSGVFIRLGRKALAPRFAGLG
jgi:hypothetical protein